MKNNLYTIYLIMIKKVILLLMIFKKDLQKCQLNYLKNNTNNYFMNFKILIKMMKKLLKEIFILF